MPDMWEAPPQNPGAVPQMPGRNLSSPPHQQTKALVLAATRELDAYRRNCVCGHEHINECGCGCTVFERDTKTIDTASKVYLADAMRWTPNVSN